MSAGGVVVDYVDMVLGNDQVANKAPGSCLTNTRLTTRTSRNPRRRGGKVNRHTERALRSKVGALNIVSELVVEDDVPHIVCIIPMKMSDDACKAPQNVLVGTALPSLAADLVQR